MMRFLRLATLPIVGSLLIAMGFRLFSDEFDLILNGERTEGRIIGSYVVHADSVDLALESHTRLDLQTADGLTHQLIYLDGELSGALPDHWLRIEDKLNQVASGPANSIRRLLLAEEWVENPASRLVRIEKVETVSGFWGLSDFVDKLKYAEGAVHIPEMEPSTITTRVDFDFQSPPETPEDDPTRMRFFSSVNAQDQPVETETDDFYFHRFPYRTQFWPVYQFQVDGKQRIERTNIGRRGGLSLALPLYTSCNIYYDPQNPARQIATPPVATFAESDDFVAWISTLLEDTFSRWGTFFIIMLLGTFFLITGLMQLSFLFVGYTKR